MAKTPQKPELKHIDLDRLVPGRYQPRRHFEPEKLAELADSIKTTDGVLQPLVVRNLDGQRYEIIAGERRWRAAQLAGLSSVACLVGHYTDEQALEASIIENVNRADLNPIEEAEAYQRMIDEFSYLHDEIAATVGKSRSKISNSLRLLQLTSTVREYIQTHQLSEGHGKILAGLADDVQRELAHKTVRSQWSVRKLAVEAKKLLSDPSKGTQQDPNVTSLEKNISDKVGCEAKIEYDAKGRGQLKLGFHNLEILQGVLAKMGIEQ